MEVLKRKGDKYKMLTKEVILDCYFKQTDFPKVMKPLIEKFFFYFQEQKNQPENLNCGMSSPISLIYKLVVPILLYLIPK